MSRVLWEQPRRSQGRRAGVAIAAVAAVGAVGWLLASALLPGDGGPRTAADGEAALGSPAPPGDRLEVRPAPDEAEPEQGPGHEGWRLLPHAPLVRRYGHSTVWTGSHLVVWGGARSDERHHGTGLTELRSGASYDPAARRWQRLPPSPLAPRLNHAAVATDGEMVIWGGQGRSGPASAAYDPVEQRWQELPPGPIDAARPRGAAWTGQLVLVWGELDGRLAAAAYDPAAESWQRLPEPPFEASGSDTAVVWVDGSLLLWQPPEAGQRAMVASWAPGDDRWRMHRPASPAPGPARLLAAGDRVLAWGGPQGERWAISYRPSSREREQVAVPPLDPQAEAVAGWDGEELVVWSAGDNRTWRIDPASGRTSPLPVAPLAPRAGADGDFWPGGLVVWGGASRERHYNDGAVLDVDVARSG